MFIISEIEDKIRVDPGDLGRPVLDAVTSVIEHLYIDKVCHENTKPRSAPDAHSASEISRW